MARRLQLLVDSYDQPAKQAGGDPTRYGRGDVFEANSDAEADRLIALGAALDPEEAAKREAERLESERAALEARKAEIDRQIEGLSSDLPPDPASLKGQALDDALRDAGLSTDGSADEKRARLAKHQANA